MATFYLRCDVDRSVTERSVSHALEHSTAREALGEALQAEVRLLLCGALTEIVHALYADRQTGELTGENTLAEHSAADFVETVSLILDRHGLTPEALQ